MHKRKLIKAIVGICAISLIGLTGCGVNVEFTNDNEDVSVTKSVNVQEPSSPKAQDNSSNDISNDASSVDSTNDTNNSIGDNADNNANVNVDNGNSVNNSSSVVDNTITGELTASEIMKRVSANSVNSNAKFNVTASVSMTADIEGQVMETSVNATGISEVDGNITHGVSNVESDVLQGISASSTETYLVLNGEPGNYTSQDTYTLNPLTGSWDKTTINLTDLPEYASNISNLGTQALMSGANALYDKATVTERNGDYVIYINFEDMGGQGVTGTAEFKVSKDFILKEIAMYNMACTVEQEGITMTFDIDTTAILESNGGVSLTLPF